MSNPEKTAKNIDNANKVLASEALTIQGYANCIKEQPKIDFSQVSYGKKYADLINKNLMTAKVYADNYLKKIQPKLIKNINNIINFYALHNAIATSIPRGDTEHQWIDCLSLLYKTSLDYQMESNQTFTMLKKLSKKLNRNSLLFANTIRDFNKALNGPTGDLKILEEDIKNLQEKYDKYLDSIIGVAASLGLAISAIIVGKFVKIVPQSIKNKLVYGGVAIIVPGTPTIITLVTLMLSAHHKIADKIDNAEKLKSEIKMATAVSNGYSSLTKKMTKAVVASTKMENAWHLLSNDLGRMVNDLKIGIIKAEQTRYIYLNASNRVLRKVISDIDIIKSQLNGVAIIKMKEGDKFEDTVTREIQSTTT